ncbi:hypothetical protein ABTE79_18890, partial [Acinetobacter baumannii]
KPVAVRYAWADHPRGNVFSSDDIPLMPFRTDEWAHRKPEEPAAKKAPSAAPKLPEWDNGVDSGARSQPPPMAVPTPPPTKHVKPANGAPFAWP